MIPIHKGIFFHDQKYRKFSYYFLYIQQLQWQISQIVKNGFNPFCDKTLHIFLQKFGRPVNNHKLYTYIERTITVNILHIITHIQTGTQKG